MYKERFLKAAKTKKKKWEGLVLHIIEKMVC